MKVWIKNYYLDGGTQQVMTDGGDIYYIDHRIGSPTDGKVFDHYPDEKEQPVDVTLEIVGSYTDWLASGRVNNG